MAGWFGVSGKADETKIPASMTLQAMTIIE
jgi:hypothetical protein